MKRICLLILSVVLILSFSACGTNQENNSENDLPINNSQTDIDTSKYIIQTPFYQIYEEDLQKYKYRITSGKDVLVEDIKTGKIENSRLFSFEVWQNEKLVQNFELNFYENEYNLFNDLLIKIFKI